MAEDKKKASVRDDIERALDEQYFDPDSPAQRRLKEIETPYLRDQAARVITGAVVGGALLGASRRFRRLRGRSKFEESTLATIGAPYFGGVAGGMSALGNNPVKQAELRREREQRRKK